MLQGNLGGPEGHIEAVGRGRCSQHHHRALAVTTVECLQQVGLLGLGRQTRRRATPLYVDNHQRQLRHHGQADTLALQGQTGTRSRGHGQVPGKRGTDGRAHAGNLVLDLNGFHAQVLALGQLVQNIGGGSNGVTAQEEG